MQTSLIWSVILGFAVMLGAATSLIPVVRLRRIAILLAGVLPSLLLLGVAIVDGCLPAITPWMLMGSGCQSWGVLLVLSIALLPLWLIGVLIGAWLVRRMLRPR